MESDLRRWMRLVESDQTADWWSGGACDIFAIALHRLYGLPMAALVERSTDEGDETLIHAFAVLPDGRMLDASGAKSMMTPDELEGSNYPGEQTEVEVRPVDEVALSRLRDDDIDYDAEIVHFQPDVWIRQHLAGALKKMGLRLLA